MLIKPIEYTNLDGVRTTRKFYFHLSKAELAKLQLKYAGGFEAFIKIIVEKKDAQQIIDTFEDIIGMSYGVRSEDGERFIKSEQQTEEFKQTEAYAQLFYELCTDSAAAAIFVKGVIPADLAAKLPDDITQVELPSGDADEVVPPKKLEEYTRDELLGLSQETFDRLVGTNPQMMPRNVLNVAFERRAKGLDKVKDNPG